MSTSPTDPTPPIRPRLRPPIGPRLRKVFWVLLALFALLMVNSVYLSAVSFGEWSTGRTIQGYFYQWMFLLHLGLGLLIVVPVVVFGIIHMRNVRGRGNRRAKQLGFALFIAAVVLLVTGLALTRLSGFVQLRDPGARSLTYWLHVLAPIAVMWLFILHRLSGPLIRWRVGLGWAAAAAALGLLMLPLHGYDPRGRAGNPHSAPDQPYFPSLARTPDNEFIPAQTLMMDNYCKRCHADVHEQWSHSVHRFSSFNNPAYKASVLGTRDKMFERDGHVMASRWCAGCHDTVPLFSGVWDTPEFSDPDFLDRSPIAQAGLTCTTCHAITDVHSVRGNAAFMIEEPVHYPFAYSDNPFGQWINETLVKAKPDFHKQMFLRPLHRSPQFCSTCHKVSLPPELNDYKWLRGQNHYDAWWVSGVSGYGVGSFYYPPKAIHSCTDCHMPLHESDDFGAQDFDGTGLRKVHDHQFPAANTAIPYLTGMPERFIDTHREFLKGSVRVDLFGVRDGGAIDSPLIAPLRPEVPYLEPGGEYLLETVVRTVRMGHVFTQGTADSNEVWVDVKVTQGGRVIGRSGGRNEDGEVDPWSHFVNVFMLDREGNRIAFRNAEDIFTPLYNHQIPPGAGAVVHYLLEVPEGSAEPITVEVSLRYRKFDTQYLRFFTDDPERVNDLPIVTISEDRVTFPIAGAGGAVENDPSPIDEWERWNDYGIGMLRKAERGAGRGAPRQAAEAFSRVAELGRPDGPLNLARVYLSEGRLADAGAALRQAAEHDPPAPPWSVAWFSGLVNRQNGFLDEAIASFRALRDMDTEETRRREFDFSKDYNLLNELGETLYERARQERGEPRRERRMALLHEARESFEQVLAYEPENATAHYNLYLLHTELDNEGQALEHLLLHSTYKVDENARDRAIAVARQRYPAANHAAEAIVIWDLQREGAFGLETPPERMARHEQTAD